MSQIGVSKTTIIKVQEEQLESVPDLLVVEAPLEIRLIYTKSDAISETSITVTMRTPGNDIELAVGFLFAEGIIDSFDAIKSFHYCQKTIPEHRENILKILLKPDLTVDLSLLDRNFTATSSCGVCGKRSISQLMETLPQSLEQGMELSLTTIYSLSKKLSHQQHLFNHTGGLHAAALFDKNGTLLCIKEDIGRHNAVDKVIGHTLVKNKKLLEQSILFISSRVGYEIIQKAAMAQIPVVIAVGAPSNIAVQIALKSRITLIGFAKNKSFNLYSGAERITETKSKNATKFTTIDLV